MAGLVSLRTLADLASHWNAHCVETPWRTSRTGNLARRLRGGVSVAIVFDKRAAQYAVRFDGGRGGVLPERFATVDAAKRTVDALEASR